jgi:hypothetical protein
VTTEHEAARAALDEIEGARFRGAGNFAAWRSEAAAVLVAFARRAKVEALREVIGDLRFYLPDPEPQTIRLGEDCTIEVDEETGDLMIRGRGESGDMSGQEFFEHVEHAPWSLRKYWIAMAAKLEEAP